MLTLTAALSVFPRAENHEEALGSDWINGAVQTEAAAHRMGEKHHHETILVCLGSSRLIPTLMFWSAVKTENPAAVSSEAGGAGNDVRPTDLA